ncbi:MAG: transporter substrate-binding domain-containing protein [Opitutaceae bacterium]
MFRCLPTLILSLAIATGSLAQPLRIGVDSNSPPLAYLGADGRPIGYSVDLLQEMKRVGGLEVEVVSDYWAGLLAQLKDGRIDAIANMAIIEERRTAYDYSIGHARMRAAVYFRKDGPIVDNTLAFKGRTLAMLEGSITTYTLHTHPQWSAKVHLFSSYESALQAVQRRECDAALFLRPLGGEVVEPMPELRRAFLDDLTYRFHFAVRKGDAATLERINQALATVQAEGLDRPLYKRWIGPVEPRPLRLADLRPYLFQILAAAALISGLVLWRMRVLAQRTRQAVALRLSEMRFRKVFENTPNIAVQGYDRNRRVIFWNDASTTFYGYSSTEALGRRLEELIIPDAMRSDVISAVDRWLKSGEVPPAEELVLRHKNGGPVKVFSSHCLTFNALGEPEMYCIDIDLAERDRALAARRELEENFRRIVETAHEGIWTIDGQGRTTFVNSRMAQMLGYTAQEMDSVHLLDRLEEPGRTLVARHIQDPNSGPISSHDVSFLRRDGSELWAAITTSPIHAAGRPHSGSLIMVTDITERKLTESQLRQSQKMEVVGQLAGGVAHDFNNILTAMLLNLNYLREVAPSTGPEDIVGDLEALTARAARLTSQLLSLARRQPLHMRPVELTAAVTDLLRMLRRLIGEHITLRTVQEVPELWVDADPGMLDQVVMNLCVNARDAMPDGGTLTLATRRITLTEKNLPPKSEARFGDFAVLQISDTGCGMTPEVLQHLFEPFFTTKDVGKGTGLGLAAVHGIVHQHRGWIDVESTPQLGSTFLVYLPLTTRRPTLTANVVETPARASGTARLLLVEDEEELRRATTGMLSRLGYQVSSAADGIEALRVWDEHQGAFDILVTDVVMPNGLNGLRLGETLRQRKPTLRVVLVSGYSSEIHKANHHTGSGITFLAKPFDAASLAEALNSGKT